MQNIYLPIDNFSDYACYIVYDKDTIRAYRDTLRVGDNNYTDFYINSNYLQKDGKQTIESTLEFPVCLDTDILTNEFAYHNRFDSILIIFIILLILLVLIPLKIFSRIFGKWLKW